MEIIIEVIVNLLIELLAPVAIQILMFFGYNTIRASLKEKEHHSRYTALLGCIVLGVLLGTISFFVYPKRIFVSNPFPGIGILISPPVTGLAMMLIGKIRKAQEKKVTVLSSFWGGFCFSLGYSVIRYLFTNP